MPVTHLDTNATELLNIKAPDLQTITHEHTDTCVHIYGNDHVTTLFGSIK